VARLVDAPVRVGVPRVPSTGTAARVARRRALAVCLAGFEALGAALGLEPPGLRGVVTWVVAGRDRHTTLARPAIPELARCAVGAGRGTIVM
jgi:hypothetical protein